MIKKIECKSTKFSLNSQRFAEKLCINMGVNGSKQKTVFRNVVPLSSVRQACLTRASSVSDGDGFHT